MASCNLMCLCDRNCSRDDDHGGGCDCGGHDMFKNDYKIPNSSKAEPILVADPHAVEILFSRTSDEFFVKALGSVGRGKSLNAALAEWATGLYKLRTALTALAPALVSDAGRESLKAIESLLGAEKTDNAKSR